MEKLIQDILEGKDDKARLREMLLALYGKINHAPGGLSFPFSEFDSSTLIGMGLVGTAPHGDLFLTSKGMDIVQRYLLK